MDFRGSRKRDSHGNHQQTRQRMGPSNVANQMTPQFQSMQQNPFPGQPMVPSPMAGHFPAFRGPAQMFQQAQSAMMPGMMNMRGPANMDQIVRFPHLMQQMPNFNQTAMMNPQFPQQPQTIGGNQWSESMCQNTNMYSNISANSSNSNQMYTSTQRSNVQHTSGSGMKHNYRNEGHRSNRDWVQRSSEGQHHTRDRNQSYSERNRNLKGQGDRNRKYDSYRSSSSRGNRSERDQYSGSESKSSRKYQHSRGRFSEYKSAWKEQEKRERSDSEEPQANEDSTSWNDKGSEAIDKYLEPGELLSDSDDDNQPLPPAWIRSSPADLYFDRDSETGNIVATRRMEELETKFMENVVRRAEKVRASKPKFERPPRKRPVHHHYHDHNHDHSSRTSSSSSDSNDSEPEEIALNSIEELERKQNHPEKVHDDLWFNESGEMNDGPLCRCSLNVQKTGIRHGIYPGEETLPKCVPTSNNLKTLYHYRITVAPVTNFVIRNPTTINHDGHNYFFEGYSLFSHHKLDHIPICRFIRFNMDYKIHFTEEKAPENFSIRSLDLFHDLIFREILELVDEEWRGYGCENGCQRFHIMPRFVRNLPDNGKEVLSMNEVLHYLISSAAPVLSEMDLGHMLKCDQREWQEFVDKLQGSIVTKPGSRPSSIRIDHLDRAQSSTDVIQYPVIVHFGIKPVQLSWSRDPKYNKYLKVVYKTRHLMSMKTRNTADDREQLKLMEFKLQDLRHKSEKKRDVAVEVSSEGWMRTGLKADICQHALILPVLISYLRHHLSLSVIQSHLGYQFNDQSSLRLALTHPSHRHFYGINPDHDRNALTNCGLRKPHYGDRRIHMVTTRKSGIVTLLNIMSKMGFKEEKLSAVNQNERLEFLGDAVVEFLTSVHLYFMFPNLEEGGLCTYRTAIVQNKFLCKLGKKLRLDQFMLFMHGGDLCNDMDFNHAIANCFEAVMGAILIDGGLDLANKIFGQTLFDEDELREIWNDKRLHPLQEVEPSGDRHWIKTSSYLQKLLTFEENTGMEFKHIRLLARAFTPRRIGYTNLTLGHNETLEFLGDTVLKLIASDYLYRHFPNHHEGHLSLLRGILVSRKVQSVVCDDLDMTEYAVSPDGKRQDSVFSVKAKADLVEAVLAALYVDQGVEACKVFCQAVFYPRLKFFILTQEWNDPKSLLQQCCLTLRKPNEEEPDIPLYKVVHSAGPTNTRIFTVAVYFREKRLAKGTGHNVQEAEMKAAENALRQHQKLFPQFLVEKKLNMKAKIQGQLMHLVATE